MKPKTKAFVNELLANPKLSNTEAYIRTHKTTNRNSARASASQLLASPSVSIYMQEHVNKAQQRIVSLVDNATKEEVQLKASQDVLDRSFGKAKQQIEVSSNVVQINIDLTGNDISI